MEIPDNLKTEIAKEKINARSRSASVNGDVTGKDDTIQSVKLFNKWRLYDLLSTIFSMAGLISSILFYETIIFYHLEAVEDGTS
jgi:hypothetical protein